MARYDEDEEDCDAYDGRKHCNIATAPGVKIGGTFEATVCPAMVPASAMYAAEPDLSRRPITSADSDQELRILRRSSRNLAKAWDLFAVAPEFALSFGRILQRLDYVVVLAPPRRSLRSHQLLPRGSPSGTRSRRPLRRRSPHSPRPSPPRRRRHSGIVFSLSTQMG